MFAFSARHLTRQAPLGATDNRQGRDPLLQSILRQLAPSGRQTMCRAGLTASPLLFLSLHPQPYTLNPNRQLDGVSSISQPMAGVRKANLRQTLNLICYHHFPHTHFPLSSPPQPAFIDKSFHKFSLVEVGGI